MDNIKWYIGWLIGPDHLIEVHFNDDGSYMQVKICQCLYDYPKYKTISSPWELCANCGGRTGTLMSVDGKVYIYDVNSSEGRKIVMGEKA